MEEKKANPLATGAWLVEWTERERGWGQRPDGAYYYSDLKTAKERTEVLLRTMREQETKIHHGAVPAEILLA